MLDRVQAKWGALPIVVAALRTPALIFGGEIRGHPASEGRIGVVVVLRVKPASDQLCSEAGRPMQ